MSRGKLQLRREQQPPRKSLHYEIHLGGPKDKSLRNWIMINNNPNYTLLFQSRFGIYRRCREATRMHLFGRQPGRQVLILDTKLE